MDAHCQTEPTTTAAIKNGVIALEVVGCLWISATTASAVLPIQNRREGPVQTSRSAFGVYRNHHYSACVLTPDATSSARKDASLRNTVSLNDFALGLNELAAITIAIGQ